MSVCAEYTWFVLDAYGCTCRRFMVAARPTLIGYRHSKGSVRESPVSEAGSIQMCTSALLSSRDSALKLMGICRIPKDPTAMPFNFFSTSSKRFSSADGSSVGPPCCSSATSTCRHQSITYCITQSINQSIGKLISQPTIHPFIHQSIDQSINQPSNQSTNQPTNQLTHQAINRLINQSIHQSIDQTTNQSITWSCFAAIRLQ